MIFLDTEPNDSFNRPSRIGALSGTRVFDGRLGNGSGNDNFDFYRFTVTQTSKFAATLVPRGGNANILLMDSNNQLIDISSLAGTSPDTVEADVLQPGDYTLQISKASGGFDFDYTVSASTTPVAQAQLSVTVEQLKALERFDTPIPFTRVGEADFRVEADFIGVSGIPDQVRRFSNDDDVRNFSFVQNVDADVSRVGFTISVTEEDPGIDDRVDIDPFRGNVSSISAIFRDQVRDRFSDLPSLGQSFTFEGNGFRPTPFPTAGQGRARITLRADYNTFSSRASMSLFRQNTPITRGTGASNLLQGQARGGILDGGKGRDEILGMGGNDALTGGKGRDDLDGGTGKDILHGGKGRDRYTGGRGRDVFVIGPDFGVDVITDFKNGRDKLGLPFGLSPELLDITQRRNNTVLGINGDKLAVLRGVDANTINARDFVSVDFAQFAGIEVPTLV
ncbi:MAG: calcium-binding protein, partial [Elainellaceae cyanobacterium]